MMNTHFLNGKKIQLSKPPPEFGSQAPNLSLMNTDNQKVSLNNFDSQPVVIYSSSSIDSKQCFKTNVQLNAISKRATNIPFIGVTMDLPMTLKRIELNENLDNVYLMSDFLGREFGVNYGVLMKDGILAGLLARSIFVLNAKHQIIFAIISEKVCHGFEDDGEELTGLNEAIDFLNKK